MDLVSYTADAIRELRGIGYYAPSRCVALHLRPTVLHREVPRECETFQGHAVNRGSTYVDVDVFVAEVCESKGDELVRGSENLVLIYVFVSQD